VGEESGLREEYALRIADRYLGGDDGAVPGDPVRRGFRLRGLQRSFGSLSVRRRRDGYRLGRLGGGGADDVAERGVSRPLRHSAPGVLSHAEGWPSPQPTKEEIRA